MVNTNLDTTPLPPNNLVAKDPVSAELAGYVRTKTFGRDVRESIARSIELNSTRSKSAEILANETVNVANDLTDRFNQQIGALTEDSEVIDARGGETTLGERLDRDLASVESIIDNKVEVLNTDIALKADTKNTVVHRKVSDLTMSELISLAADVDIFLNLDVDVDLIVTTPIFFTRCKIRTSTGSRLVVKNEQYVTFSDRTDYKHVHFVSENKTRAPIDIRRMPTDLALQKKAEIIVKEFAYTGDTGYNADFMHIYGAPNGLFGLTVSDIWGMNANNVFMFKFVDSDDWTTSNSFTNIFFGAFRRFVNYTVVPADFNLRTMFGGNMFDNLQGQTSSLFIEIANDLGLNRYTNSFMWDIKAYNRQPNVNKTGNIVGPIRGGYFSNTKELPQAIIRHGGGYYRIGTFLNVGAVAEIFLRIKVFAPLQGMKVTYDITRGMDGVLIIKANSNENKDTLRFYTSQAANGGTILWFIHSHGGWSMFSINERMNFVPDPEWAISFTEEETKGILSPQIQATYDSELVV